jgi:N-acetylglucosaminyl-diphospho-decaprenol L-rhamnosyltransferase
VDDLAIIVVSTNEASWLPACLSSVYAHAGECALDVVVVDNESSDGTAEIVERDFPRARVVRCSNFGFGHANNRGLMTTDARHILFLNPDTEILEGTFAELVAALDERPAVGLLGVRQLTGDGELYPTIRRFPNALRALGQGLLSERFPYRPALFFERELDPAAHDRETDCDWTSGSFMLCRREALESAGIMDERYFIYSEEPDLCLRMKRAGWEVRHVPTMTIVHHAEKAGVRPKMAAQDLYSRLQYAAKHFSPAHRVAYEAALGLALLRRWLVGGDHITPKATRRSAEAAALRVLARIDGPPFGDPPGQAVRLRPRGE